MTAILLAIKMNDDPYYHQSYYSQVLGINEKKLTSMELTFLKLLGHNTVVGEE